MSNLDDQLGKLTQEHDALKARYAELKAKHEALLADYATLSAKAATLEREAKRHSTKGWAIANPYL